MTASVIERAGLIRHNGKVLVEAAAASEYLKTIKAEILETSRCEVTNSIRQTDIGRLSQLANSPL